jgi:aminoglycoside phosphotransferase (APT) family kinase protein
LLSSPFRARWFDAIERHGQGCLCHLIKFFFMTTLNDFRVRLERFLAEKACGPVQVTAARRLTGGASRESWAIDIDVASGPHSGKHALVLRRDMGGVIHQEALTREQEYQVLVAAYRAGVKVPRPRWVCSDPNVVEVPFFLMDRVEGESVGRRIVRDPNLAEARKLLPRQMGEQLALIHRIDWKREGLDFLLDNEPGCSAAQTAVNRATRQLERFGEPHPALQLALRWLRAHVPADGKKVLVHADFRIGNLMVGPDGLRAVFDWEFSHLGDPIEDLVWPCVRSWRFGHDDLQMGGVGQPEEFWQAYEQAGGDPVNRQAMKFWEILGNFRWAVGCISQANRHLSGQAPSIELASLGRRAAEMELEALDLKDRVEAAH